MSTGNGVQKLMDLVDIIGFSATALSRFLSMISTLAVFARTRAGLLPHLRNTWCVGQV